MNEKTVGMLIGKKNVYEYPELSNAVTCMNYVNKETEIPPVLMMHGLADDKAWRSGILDREEYGYCGKISESPHGLRRYRLYYLLYSIPDLQCNVSGIYLYRSRIWNSGSDDYCTIRMQPVAGNKFNTDKLIYISWMCTDRDGCTALL